MTTVRVGLVGSGIQASLSPALHMAEGAAQGLNYRYELFDLTGTALDRDILDKTIRGAKERGFRGLNVTHPFKQMAATIVDELSPDAAALGSINTIVLKDGHRVGHNTDWSGYAEGFRRTLLDVTLDRVVQLGAGGAGTAVAHALMTMGTEHLTLIDRDPARSAAVAANLSKRFDPARITVASDAEAALAMADGLVNATPIGMDAYPGMPVAADLLRPALWVSEIIYFPLRTELLATAQRLGCRTADGGGMAVFQAVAAFKLFSGLEPNSERMLATFAALQAAMRTAA